MLEYISEYFVEVLQNIWQSVATKLQALTDLCIGYAFKFGLPIPCTLYFIADINRFKCEKFYFMSGLARVKAAKKNLSLRPFFFFNLTIIKICGPKIVWPIFGIYHNTLLLYSIHHLNSVTNWASYDLNADKSPFCIFSISAYEGNIYSLAVPFS